MENGGFGTVIRERCSCGAEIETDEDEALKILRAWRREHVCLKPAEFAGSVGSSSIETAPNFVSPELHIGFRYQEEEDET